MNKKFAIFISLIACLALLIVVPVTTINAGRSRGDVNQDNEIDMKDVLALRKQIAGVATGLDLVLADANGDNEIDMKDVLLLRKHIANIPVSFAPLPDDSSVVSVVSTPSEVSTVSVVSTPSEVSTASVVSTPSEVSTVSTTSTSSTVSNPSGQVTLTINVTEESPRYTNNTIQKSWQYNVGETATFTVSMDVFKGDEKEMSEILSYVNLTNCTLQGTPTVGEPVS
ncbi:MAG: dockerin type I repeat-containing protein, partial [Clostridia bacterium]|nr:dockerin type I repeat-containing protein [Clostridia bacterium]